MGKYLLVPIIVSLCFFSGPFDAWAAQAETPVSGPSEDQLFLEEEPVSPDPDVAVPYVEIMPESVTQSATSGDGTSDPVARPLSVSQPGLGGAGPSADNFIYTGAATYSLPVELPPGRAGMQPEIVLSYNSQRSGGIVGQGWNLNQASISRSVKNGLNPLGTGRVL